MSQVPRDLKYTKDHEWARIDGDRVKVGITAYAVEQLGDVTLVDLPPAGTKVTAHQRF
jgi:glycine cleavage system H protein